MTSSLSAYWVKFFKGAGFPQDVATKHAVVFSNNRIKPDMLPDLDKPSLKEMGITLMGDMIAILRYAKKVVEETTCEKFLVDSEDSSQASSIAKPIVKKVISKPITKTVLPTKTKVEPTNASKLAKASSASVVKPVVTKKVIPATKGSTVSNNKERQVSIKRKVTTNEESFNEEDEWSTTANKKLKTTLDTKDDDRVGYTIILPKTSTARSQQILKKSIEQKRTVFDRLGDSSVTSTTNSPESSTTFNVTGLGKDIYKRTVSVFNRLGDKDVKKESILHTGILKNGTSDSTSQGILKNRTLNMTPLVVPKKVVTKPAATMRADIEAMKNSSRIKRIGTTTKKLIFDGDSTSGIKRVKTVLSSKLASERLASVPAKARLGIVKTTGSKQVTFNKVATVTHVKKPDVFSRLGI